jgi:hypothetical protein
MNIIGGALISSITHRGQLFESFSHTGGLDTHPFELGVKGV